MVHLSLSGLESGTGFGATELSDVEYLNVVFEPAKVSHKSVTEIRFSSGWETNHRDDDLGFGIVGLFNYMKISISPYMETKHSPTVPIPDTDGARDGALELCLITFVVSSSVFSLIICQHQHSFVMDCHTHKAVEAPK